MSREIGREERYAGWSDWMLSNRRGWRSFARQSLLSDDTMLHSLQLRALLLISRLTHNDVGIQTRSYRESICSGTPQ